jgi:hypothetical protein
MIMQKEFDVSDEYAKERDQQDENKYFLMGMAMMIVAAGLDWELFQWIYTIIQARH